MIAFLGGRALVTVLLPFAGGYFVSYLFRNVNAVIAPDLIRDFQLQAGDLGLLTSAYFLAFAAFQLPLGALLDRYGPRRVQSVLLLFAAAGAALFAVAQSFDALLVARALIGLGVSGCLIAALKAISQWFPPERWAVVNGLFITAGGLGGLAATDPVQWALGFTDWRTLFWTFAAMTVLVLAAIFLITPERRQEGEVAPLLTQARGFGEIFTSGVFWRVVPFCSAAYVAQLSLQGLWFGPWLRDVHDLGREDIAQRLFALALGFALGSTLIGIASERWIRWGGTLLGLLTLSGGLFCATFALLIAGVGVNEPALWFAVGALTNAASLAYALLSQLFPPTHVGRVNTAYNLVTFTGIFIFQWAIGLIIDLWPQPAPGQFAPAGYAWAFWLTFASLFACWLWLLLRAPRTKAA